MSRFVPEGKALSVDAIVKLVGGEKYRGSSSLMARGVSTSHLAEPGMLCFAQKKAVALSIPNEKGIICLAAPEVVEYIPQNVAVIVTPEPKRVFGLAMAEIYPAPEVKAGISPSAHIEDGAEVSDTARIDAGANIGEGAEIGAGAWIKAGASIGMNCIIGDGTVVESNAVIAHAVIGKKCRIGAGASIGATGFGVGIKDGGHGLVPHIGSVIMGDYCSIGANTCIDRGFLEDTTLGDHVMIDNHVQVGHNVTIGDSNVICAQVGIAGSVAIGDDNLFGSQGGIADHVTIGSGNVFAARTGITKDIDDDNFLSGFPAVPIQEFRRQVIAIRRLTQPKK